MLRYGSVCSGIEAATAAWHSLGWEPAFFSEIDPFPRAVLQHHYPEVPLHGDFTTIEPGQYGPIDILVGGTPCQSFSIAGLRGGLGDDRGNLALEFLKLAGRLRPKWLVWENVPGVLSSVSHDAPDPCPPDIDLEGDDVPEDGEEVVVTDEYEADESHALLCFLAGAQELGYFGGFRVVDAQYARTCEHPWAVPQRRRRVLFVGYLGDWRPAPAVLFDRESLSGHPPPRREAGKAVAPTLSARAKGGGGLGTDFDVDGGLIANSGDVAYCMTASAQNSLDAETETLIAFDCKGTQVQTSETGEAPTLRAMGHANSHQNAGGQIAVAHALRGEGFDASEDGTGRGTPIVPVAFAENSRAELRLCGGDGSISSQLTTGGGKPGQGQPCIAQPYTISARGRQGSQNLEYRQEGTANAILTPTGGRGGMGVGAIAHDWAVRRLTPRECERLMGFPDDFTDIPWRGKPGSPDGRRYKALGNSMAVNVMRWLGDRIQIVEAL